MSENVGSVVTLGAVSMAFNSVELGHTSKNTKVIFKQDLHKTVTGKYGKVTTNVFRGGLEVMVEAELLQTDLVNIQGSATGSPYPFFKTITGGSGTKLGFGEIAGTQTGKQALTLTPFLTDASQNTNYILTLTQAAAIGDPELAFNGEGQQVWKVKFEGCIDEGQVAGLMIGSFGKPAATQASSAPTVSSVVPTAGATGVSHSTTVVWTMSEALNGNTVGSNPAAGQVNTVQLYAVSTNNLVPVAGATVLVNNGASTTITFTPTSTLSGSTVYWAVLTSGILDQYGNALVATASDFTTT